MMMNNKKFQELIKKRSDWVELSKSNHFVLDDILAGLYNDPARFIYELIQNAEDAGASSISFNLHGEYLEVIHNAIRDFDFNDVDGITGIGNSEKDINKIGKFGVGFKSVFAITETPIIESGKFHFEIVNFVLPKLLPLASKKIDGTRIKLPFNHPTRKKGEAYELIKNKLQNIGLRTLLFLSNIKEIKWSTPQHSGRYFCENQESLHGFDNTEKASLTSQTGDEKYFEEYLILSSPIEIDGTTLKVKIAYRLEIDGNHNEQIIPVSNQDSYLVAYFPTEKVTYLNFIVQGPFKTTPNRENIPLDDSENKIIIKEIANLVCKSMSVIKKLDLLSIKFLSVLPINDEHCNEPIYSAIYDKVKEEFLSDKKFLPTNSGGYAHPSDSILARGIVLTKLLKQKDMQLLFNKSHWLNKNITADRTKELRDYLINELDIDEINFEDFAVKIDEKFMKSKSDDWVVKLYKDLIDREPLFKPGESYLSEGILRNKPIIRLKGNKHIPPFDSSGKIQIYLPTGKKTLYKTVKPSIEKHKTARKFLEKLGVTKPDAFAEINEFVLPDYTGDSVDVSNDKYLEDMDKILSVFSKNKSSDKSKSLITALAKLKIIKASNPTADERKFMLPNEVYLNNEELRYYFEGNSDIFFVDEYLYKKFNKKNLEALALACGCHSSPKRIACEIDSDKKTSLRGSTRIRREICANDYGYDGLENIIKNMNIEKSVSLWRMLLKSLSNYDGHANHFFCGEYRWFYRYNYSEYFDAKFKNILNIEKWLFNKNGEQVKPDEILISDLDDRYLLDNEHVTVLKNVLNFKIDEIQRIEEETGGKFIPAEEVDDFNRYMAEKQTQKENQDWEPDVLPGEIEAHISEEVLEPVVNEDLMYQAISEDVSNDNRRNDTVINSDNDRMLKKKIGKWGEEYVFEYFSGVKFSKIQERMDTAFGFSGKDEYGNVIEVKWLNNIQESGKGYDFVIIKNGEEVEYVEVKTTIGSDKSPHKITGTQWEFARSLYNNGAGEKYKIYTVINANSNDAKIRYISNPIKLWKEGKLYAHPINFKV